MAALFRISPNSLQVDSSTRVLTAAEADVWLQAHEVLAAARQRAQDMDAAAKLAYEEQKVRGYEDGQEACRGKYAEKVLEVALQSVEYIEGLEQTIVKVVNDAVRRVIGELDDNERIVRIVRTALASVRSHKKVVVRVATGDEKAVSEGLGALISHVPGTAGFLDVVSDPRLKPGSCILESELGVVDASLETQLRALEKAFSARTTGS